MLGNNATVGLFGVNLRDEPTTNSAILQKIMRGETLMLDAYTRGSSYSSSDGSINNLWLRLKGTTDWVAAGYVDGENLSNLAYINLGTVGQYDVNLRDEPTTQSSIIQRYRSGTTLAFNAYTTGSNYISANGSTRNTWLRLDNSTDWIAAGYINGVDPASLPYINLATQNIGTVGQYGVNLRDQPTTQSQQIQYFAANKILTFDGYTQGENYYSVDGSTDNIWLRIANTTDWVAAGYINGENLSALTYINLATKQTGTVGANGVRRRDEPTTNSQMIQFLAPNTTVSFDAYTKGASYTTADGGTDDIWLRLTNTTDWIAASYVNGKDLSTLIYWQPPNLSGSSSSVSDAGLQFISRHEGMRLQLYNDPAGHATIGVGHLVHKGPINGSEPEEFRNGITEQRAFELLRQDIKTAENAVRNLVKVSLNQAQFDALASFTFNLGAGSLQESDLLARLNAGNYAAVPDELNRWVYGSGQKLPGLVKRRQDEGKLFSSSLYV